VLALAGGAEAAAAQGPATATVYHTVHVKSNSIVSVKVTCPPGYFAVFGGLSTGRLIVAGRTGLLLSALSFGRGFTFRLGNPVTSPDQFVVLAVRCVRKGAVKPPRNVRALQLKVLKRIGSVVVPPGRAAVVKAACPAGSDLSGIGYDERPAGGRAVAAGFVPPHQAVHVFAEVPLVDKHEEAIAAENGFVNASNGLPERVSTQAICIKRSVQGRRRGHAFALRYQTFGLEEAVGVPSNSQLNTTLNCLAHSSYVAAGFDMPEGVIARAGPAQRRRPWATFGFYNPLDTTQSGFSIVLCAEAAYTG
jgi:hypothetical protein